MQATITDIWRYPVKSLGGERLEQATITDVLDGDRVHGVIDAATGALLSGKTEGRLLEASARIDAGRCVLTLPSGDIEAGDPAVHDTLSAWLGREVRLTTPGAGERAVIECELDTGEAHLTGPLPIVEFETQPGWFYDSSSSLHLVSTATLAHLEREAGPGAGDVRRYRPNLVIDLDEDFGEDEWVGATLALGGATAWVKKRTDRCVLITRAIGGHPPSRDALRHLAAKHDRCAGISLQPRSPGDIRVGDPVR